MKSSLRNFARFALGCGMAVCLAATPAMAQGSKSGGSSTGGGGGGGTVPAGLTSVTLPFTAPYYGILGSGSTVPKGTVTMSFDATQSTRILTFSISHIALADGTIISGNLFSNALVDYSGAYPVWIAQPLGNMVVQGGTISATFSTLNGNPVPLFGTSGNFMLSAFTPLGASIGFIGFATYPTNTGGGGGGGGGSGGGSL